MAVANAFLDLCRFLATSTGTGSFVSSGAITGYRDINGNGVDGALYSYRAESSDLTQWEYGVGTYTASTHTLARTTVSLNSSGGSTALSFSAAPQVAIVELSQDIQNAGLFTSGTVPTARLGSGTANSGTALFGDQTYKAISNTGVRVSKVYYTSTQTITIPAGATQATIRLLGAGGGGSGTGGGGCICIGRGPGAAGGGLEKTLTGLTPGNTLALTIGAAGTAGAAGNNAGGNGGNSTLASGTQTISTLTANGGAGGPASTNGAAGGTASGGDINITGASTQQEGNVAIPAPGSPFGLGFGGNGSGASTGYGAGGNTGFGLGSAAGVAGRPGVCVIEWFA